MPVTNDDLNAIAIRQYDVTFNGVGLGATVEGSAAVSIEGQYTVVDNATELEGIIAQIERAIVPSFSCEFLRADFDYVQGKLLKGRVEVATDGTNQNFKLGTKNRNLHSEFNGILDLHPTGVPLSDKTQHIRFHKAAMIVEGVQFTSSREAVQTFTVSFTVFPDRDQLAGEEFGVFGDFTVISPTPVGLWLTMDKVARFPFKHVPAVSLDPSGVTRIQAYAGFTTDSADTLDIDDVSGLTADLTDTSLTFDALTTDNVLVDGSVIHAAGEYMIVDGAPTYTSATAGTAVLVRAAFGTTLASHANDVTLTITNAVAKQNVTDIAALASSSPSNLTIGNVFQSSVLKNLNGIIAHVAVGSSNFSATLNAVPSPAMVGTAN